jgi:acyl carrier protein
MMQPSASDLDDEQRRSDPSLFQQLSAIMRKEVEQADLTIVPETIFDDLPGWDSLVMTGVLLEIERQIGTRLPRGEAALCQTVADLMALIRQVMSVDRQETG